MITGMDPYLFTTARLRCRRWQPSDLETLFSVYSDPEVIRWVDDGIPITHDECLRWFEVTNSNYARRGYGMFALEEIATKCVVGFCGLVHPNHQIEPEIKYALKQSVWGRGFASECVPALLNYGADEHSMDLIIATVDLANLASQRVLIKSGLSLFERRVNSDGSTTGVFHWRKSTQL